MYKVIITTLGETTTTQYNTIEEASNYSATLQNLLKGAGQIMGLHYDLELVEV